MTTGIYARYPGRSATEEADLAFELAQLVENYLAERGVKTLMIRDSRERVCGRRIEARRAVCDTIITIAVSRNNSS